MWRGVVSGLLWGLIVGGGVAAVSSLITPLPTAATPDAAEIEVPAGSGFDTNRDDEAAAVAPVDDAAPNTEVSEVAQPEEVTAPTLSADATQPASQPTTSDVDVALAAPAETVEAPQVGTAVEEPVLAVPQATAPTVPLNEDDAAISTDPAQPIPPEPVEDAAMAAPVDDTAPALAQPVAAEDGGVEIADGSAADEAASDAAAETASSEAAPETSAPALAQPEQTEETAPAEVAQNAAEDAEEPAATEEEMASTSDTTAAEAEEAGTNQAEADADVAEAAPAQDTQETEVEAETEGETAEAGDTTTTRPTVGLTNRAPGVTTNRLPTVATTPEVEENAEVAAAAEVDPDAPPIVAFAAEFSNPEGKPPMSIVLLDTGNTAAQLSALGSLSAPITFAIDATRADASEAMQLYRDAGYEVVALANIPEGARATDVAVLMEGYLSEMDQVVGVLDGTGSGFRGDRRLAEQVSDFLAASGHGLLTYDVGLGAAVQVAQSLGVPSKGIFRDLDAGNQKADVIRRFLDQAAFRAGQEGGVVMLGRMRAETITALLIWEQQQRAQTVALAPLSAVLTAE